MSYTGRNNPDRDCDVVVLGIFVADLVFGASRLPQIGETLIGSNFAMGPGGKGANQSVAAARAGARTAFISKLGKDPFGDMALKTWAQEGISTHITRLENTPTGAAFVYVNEQTGENAIIVVPGAAAEITAHTVDEHADLIKSAKIFMTQLEQPVPAAHHAMRIARNAGTLNIFNPAPAEPFPEEIYPLCDFLTPNESEASALCGIEVVTIDDARRAADILLRKGVGCALITLGGSGALFQTKEISQHVPARAAGPVVDTTGAGDAFNGSFAAALARGDNPLQAVKFANTAAGISVTRPGTASAMPELEEILEKMT